MTFEPHPREYFAALNRRPELAPTRISGLRDKLAALARYGISQVVVERFNSRLAEMSANAFIENLLVQGLQTRWLLVGEDFRFGHKRSGDIDLLREAGLRHGFEVQTLADVTDQHGHRISSSEVRTALAVGDLERARHLLGHPFHISGHVIHGQKLGRTLGFPTMNLRVAPRCAARSGIYVVRSTAWATAPCRPWPAWACARRSRTTAGCCWRPTCSTRPSMLTVNSCESNSCTSCGTKKNFPISLP